MTRNKPRPCPRCGMCGMQITNGHLKRHIEACVRGKARNKNRTCPRCGKTFTRPRNLT